MASDQIPVNGFLGEQFINVFVRVLCRWTKPLQVFPVPYSRHQLDAKQKCQPINRSALRLGIAMQNVRLDVRFVLGQAIKNVDGLPGATRDEMREQRDVGVADVIVGDTAIASVPTAFS